MAKYVIEDTTLNNTANAIREKTGKTDKITPSNFATEIASIESGGGSTVTKGIIINKLNGDGYATDVSIVGMTTIPKYYFYGGDKNNLHVLSKYLKKVNLPQGLISIGERSFAYNQELNTINLPDTLVSIGNYGFSRANIDITELPISLVNIGSFAFEYNYKMTSLQLLGLVNNIGMGAFQWTNNLKKFIMPNITQVPTADVDIFDSGAISKGTGYIYVPDALVDSFKSATNWSTYADQIKPISELEASV